MMERNSNKPLSRRTYRWFTRFNSFNPFILGVPLALLLLWKPTHLQEEHNPVKSEPASELSLLFIGDIMQHMPQVEAAWNDSLSAYIYDSCFKYVTPFITSYDIAVANLETTLAGKPYSGYPAFSSPDELVNGMLHAGIDIVGTANNHCCDRGRTGIIRTITILDSLGMKHLGTYKSTEEYRKNNPMLIRKNGISIALLNYTFGTNGIPVPEGTEVSLIDKERITNDLVAARSSSPDKIILFMHWGDEYQREPNEYQKSVAKLCLEQGADIIIGSHPHVIQSMEWHKADSIQKENLIVWSLGNYVSNQRKRYTDGGVMAGITLRKENGKTVIKNADYRLSWVYNPIQHGKRQYYILPVDAGLPDSSYFDKESLEAMKLFIQDSRDLLQQNLNIPEKPFSR